MPLDPIMKAFIDQMALQPAPKMYELPAAAARLMFAAIMEMTGPKDVPIGKVANLVCPGPGGDIPLRIYTPVAAAAETHRPASKATAPTDRTMGNAMSTDGNVALSGTHATATATGNNTSVAATTSGSPPAPPGSSRG